jgi:hypothetical protein
LPEVGGALVLWLSGGSLCGLVLLDSWGVAHIQFIKLILRPLGYFLIRGLKIRLAIFNFGPSKDLEI